MDGVDIFLLYVVGLCVILFLIVDSYEESRKSRHKAGEECVRESDDIIIKGDEKCETQLVSDDDDWEGIERTELEKMFGEAVAFVSRKSSSSINGDLKLKLYGLQKLALQGPCHGGGSQPFTTFFNLSARSNWNAWQKVGDMSREMAMEEYINTLEDAIPEWKEHSSS